MKKYHLLVKSLNSTIDIVSSEGAWIEKLRHSEFLKRYIPGYELPKDGKKIGGKLVLEKEKPNFSLEFPNAIYSNLKYDEKDIISVAEFLLERLRQEEGCYCMHSSSAVVNGKGVIFWGWASGIGKTRLSIGLAKKHGAKFFSDEKTLIDLKKESMLGGVQYAHLSKSYFDKIHKGKKFLDFTASRPVAKISFFVYPQVLESGKLFVEKWSSDKLEWHLYEELARKIRATSRRLFKNTLPVLPIDTLALSKKRSLCLKSFVKHVPCYYMRGPEKQIIGRIFKMAKLS